MYKRQFVTTSLRRLHKLELAQQASVEAAIAQKKGSRKSVKLIRKSVNASRASVNFARQPSRTSLSFASAEAMKLPILPLHEDEQLHADSGVGDKVVSPPRRCLPSHLQQMIVSVIRRRNSDGCGWRNPGELTRLFGLLSSVAYLNSGCFLKAFIQQGHLDVSFEQEKETHWGAGVDQLGFCIIFSHG